MTLEYIWENAELIITYRKVIIWVKVVFIKIIIWVENTLIKLKEFSLPKRKELLEDSNDIEVILVDATETPIERPSRNKKTKRSLQW